MVFSKFKANIVDEHGGRGLILKRTRVVPAHGALATASPEAPRYLDQLLMAPPALRAPSLSQYSHQAPSPPGLWIDPRALAQRTPPSLLLAALLVFSTPMPPRRPLVTYRHLAPSMKTPLSELPLPLSEHLAEAIFDQAPPRKSLLKRLNSQKQRKPKAPRTAMEWAGLPPRETLPPRVVSRLGEDDDDLPLCGPWNGR